MYFSRLEVFDGAGELMFVLLQLGEGSLADLPQVGHLYVEVVQL